MPRAKVRPATVRSDGTAMTGTTAPGQGQPNGREVGAVPMAAAAGAGTTPAYGEGGQLRANVQQTPAQPGVPGPSDLAQAARATMRAHGWVRPDGKIQHPNVTPLAAPSARPWEHVAAGAPLGPGPVNPMALPTPDLANDSLAQMFQQAAAVSGSPTLAALAARAQAVSAGQPPMP